ncbi:osmoprotectant transport system permease protein [Nocardioides albertanoniae]|uniref:Osmoprotectant transport system permease protein n=1 Tax=Nocardioides albertanoniae TaxID=1175486 RepID=A0A543A0S9_9ACTN|nr:ABC transporter permease [Nocardioides albertanoniae]TQL66198.1 osmoprotectant transport system permease protein [Nocardioides albertanoniae]
MSLDYLLDPTNWAFASPDGFPQRILEHLGYTALALLIAAVIAFPIGLLIGHTGRGALVAINLGNAGRALPTLGVLMLALGLIGIGLVPVTIALVVLAIPPVLASTYAGIRSVADETVDAARGVGMTEVQIAWRVEVPIALPLLIGGLRNASLQVVSTASIAAYAGLGGLGRYLFDGLATLQYDQVVAGAIVLAALAVAIDLVLAGAQRLLVSPGVDGRSAGDRPSTTETAPAEPISAAT